VLNLASTRTREGKWRKAMIDVHKKWTKSLEAKIEAKMAI